MLFGFFSALGPLWDPFGRSFGDYRRLWGSLGQPLATKWRPPGSLKITLIRVCLPSGVQDPPLGPKLAPGWPKHPPKLRKTMKMSTGMIPKRPEEKPNHKKMTSQPMPMFIFVHLVPPPLFSPWSLILGGDPSGEDGTVAEPGAKRH